VKVDTVNAAWAVTSPKSSSHAVFRTAPRTKLERLDGKFTEIYRAETLTGLYRDSREASIAERGFHREFTNL